ncbi:ROK family protein [Sphingomonas sp. 10B4]|uniref:ROK family protein n=1 Tax=Sphingomonas sp. 10B4 TaxID=3048575 RepID=UPI002AB44930|nr:ROK family protein [Sphingomonas sp. 10B4]MDY7526248.1 ROK family protein [Sphingomonas sp. 10B4]MEB0283478.1 ROK family protein [Sphingomonas sp. 10B4]
MNDAFTALSEIDRRVIEAVYRAKELSRARIADLTGLRPPIVSTAARSLIDRRLLVERAAVRGGRGQPSRPLAVNPEGGYSFGVIFTARRITVGLVDLAGDLVAQETVVIERFSVPELLRQTRALIARLQRQASVPSDRVLGIGINVPATASSQAGYFHTHDYFAEMRGVDLLGSLRAGLPFPVTIETDPICAAIGERLHGVGRDFDNFFQIHIAFRYGGALMLEGRPYRGAHGNAGVIGIVFPVNEPRPSGQDLLEHLSRQGMNVGDFADLIDLDIAGCPPLIDWLDRAAGQLGRSIELVSRFFDPEAIVIGGRIPSNLIAALLERIDLDKLFDYSKHMAVPAVVPSLLAEQAGLIGAASAPIIKLIMSK